MPHLQLELIHLALGFMLLLVMNIIGTSPLLTAKYTSFSDFFSYDSSVGFNAILRILAPSVFTVAVSIGLYSLGIDSLVKDIWLVAVYYALIQALLVFLVLDRGRLVKKSKFIFYHVLAIALSYWIYNYAIMKGLAYLLPDEANFRTEMWFVIILFIYGLFNYVNENRDQFRNRQKNYVTSKYATFTKLYGSLLKNKPQLLTDVIYSLMIYEDYVRPRSYRRVEKLLSKFKLAHTTGIMQVKSKKPLGDKESIKMTIKRLEKLYNSFSPGLQEYEKINQLISAHNDDYEYCRRVWEIYELVKKN